MYTRIRVRFKRGLEHQEKVTQYLPYLKLKLCSFHYTFKTKVNNKNFLGKSFFLLKKK